MERRPEGHVLDAKRRDHRVVRFRHRRGDDKGIGIGQAGGEANRREVKVRVEDRQQLVFTLLVQIEERDLARFVFARKTRIVEAFEPRHRFAGL